MRLPEVTKQGITMGWLSVSKITLCETGKYVGGQSTKKLNLRDKAVGIASRKRFEPLNAHETTVVYLAEL